jgi:hypothetical protein
MTDQPNLPPISEMPELPPDETPPIVVNEAIPLPPPNGNYASTPEQPISGPTPPTPPPQRDETPEEARARLERLGGEPAPDITPEEFARLRQSGQIHIDVRGRVRSRQSNEPSDAGISLRKRRAWYTSPV